MGDKQYKTNNYTDFFYKTFRNILIISIPLVIISALILSLPHSSASTDQIEFSLSVSCTMSSVVNTAHTKEITNGTYHPNVGKTTITTLCNDGNGYTVYATGYSNNEVGNNKLINTANSQYSIDTGLATSGLTSTWAMKLNNLENDPSSTPPIIESAYDDTYGLVPSGWTKVASRPSGTTDMNLGSSFTTTYSIYTSSSQFAGTYRGQVKYALLHPYSNANTPSFDSFDQAFAFYEKEKVTITDPITGDTGSYYKMQDIGSGICNNISSTGEGTATQLVDIRDNKLYWIAKLADNKCWMTQNLDLDLSHEVALTSETSDIDPDTYDTGVYTSENGYSQNGNTVSWLPSTIVEVDDGQGGTTQAQRADTLSINWTSNTAASISDWANNNNSPYSADAGDRYIYTDNSGTRTIYTSLTTCSNTTNDTKGCQRMHVGNYYNLPAVVASNNTSSVPNNSTFSNSICPKNWSLPIIDDYMTLLQTQSVWTSGSSYAADGFLKARTSPLYFVLSGYISNGSLYRFGQYIHDWSNASRYLYLRGDAIFMDNRDNGATGMSVRCLVR